VTLATGEFIRRFLIHVLPKGLHRIRHYGLCANGDWAENLARVRALLVVATPKTEMDAAAGADPGMPDALTHPCPCCGGRMIVIEIFKAGCQPRYRPPASSDVIRIDTS